MQDTSNISKFQASIRNFVASKDNPQSVLAKVMKSSPENAEKLAGQMKTFESDMEKLEKGKMSYAEMRSLYG